MIKLAAISLPGQNNNGRRRPLAAMLMVAALGSTLTGCGATSLRQQLQAHPLVDIQATFRQTGSALITALRRLKSLSDVEQRIDYQTAITLETLRISPRHVAERRLFYQEAERLDQLLATVPTGKVPRDSAVLAYLAKLASGTPGASPYLSALESENIVSLCGPSHKALARKGSGGAGAEDEMLRQACFTWILGDAAKSRALLYYVTVSQNAAGSLPSMAGPEGSAFDRFITRLRVRSGVDLFAHRRRLGDSRHVQQALTPGYSRSAWHQAPNEPGQNTL